MRDFEGIGKYLVIFCLEKFGILLLFIKIDIKVFFIEVLNLVVYIICIVGNVGLKKID